MWSAPLDGSTASLEMTTRQTTDNPTTLTSRISTALGYLLVAWIAVSAIFISHGLLLHGVAALNSIMLANLIVRER